MRERHEWTEGGKRYLADDADGGRLGGTPPSLEEAPAASPDYAEYLHRSQVMSAAAREILRLAARVRKLEAEVAGEREAKESFIRAYRRFAPLKALLASERPPQAMADAYYGRGGGPWTPMERVWRWLREQLTARHGGLTQGGSMSDENRTEPTDREIEQQADAARHEEESAHQEPETGESTAGEAANENEAATA